MTKSPQNEMTHRDEVHGDVRFDRLAVSLLDTPAMQRLGRVNQLGYAPLVYRGGNHSRLSHVMGAYAMAGKLVDALRRNYEGDVPRPRGAVEPDVFLPMRMKQATVGERWSVLRNLVGWSALLHDLAHIPLGHTLEDEFDRIYIKHDDFRSPRIPYLWHETAPGRPSAVKSVLMDRTLHPEVFGKLGISGEQVWRAVMVTCFYKEDRTQETARSFRDVLSESEGSRARDELLTAIDSVDGKLFFPYMADIVADTICADYLDYLQRDPRNLGLDVLRDDRVVSHFWIGKRRRTGRLHMALSLVDKRGKPRLDTTTGVVDLVRQRYRFAEIVYYHKTKASASAMFAKALGLIGGPDECPPNDRFSVEVENVNALVDRLFGRGKDESLSVSDFERQVLPSALLDVAVGDEALHILMQQRAAAQIRDAVASQDVDGARRALRALALIQAISKRCLYKVSFSLDSEAWEEFFPGTRRDNVARGELERTIRRLRTDSDYRASIEEQMRGALSPNGVSNGFYDPFLLYVPPRKSQAKGIETGALDEGEVITLGEHDAVRAQVNDLSHKYADLWKLIVLVHPKFDDPIALSQALQVLVEQLIPNVDLRNSGRARDAMERCCWFEYVHVELQMAGSMYSALPLTAPKNFRRLAVSKTTSLESLSDREIVYRTAVIDRLIDRGMGEGEASKAVAESFSGAGHLELALSRELPNVDLFTGSSEGEPGATREALYRIADNLFRKSIQQ